MDERQALNYAANLLEAFQGASLMWSTHPL